MCCVKMLSLLAVLLLHVCPVVHQEKPASNPDWCPHGCGWIVNLSLWKLLIGHYQE